MVKVKLYADCIACERIEMVFGSGNAYCCHLIQGGYSALVPLVVTGVT